MSQSASDYQYNDGPIDQKNPSHEPDKVEAATGEESVQSTLKSRITSLESCMRQMQVGELSANDDDEYFPEPMTHLAGDICHRVNQTTRDVEYDMSHAQRGKCIIVNNVNFAPETRMPERAGSQKDGDELSEVTRTLGFSTERYTDLTRFQIMRVLENVSKEDHSDYDCFMFVIMTHGSDGVIYGTDGVLSPNKLTEQLRGDSCPTLAGKPKIFFIQACRGERLDDGVELLTCEDVTDEPDSGSSRQGSVVIPAEADFLVAYSSPPGYYSWRNISSGAWFIQALIEVLRDYGTSLEINQLLTRVNHAVAYHYESNSNMVDFHNKKQMPFYTSTLTKELYLRVDFNKL